MTPPSREGHILGPIVDRTYSAIAAVANFTVAGQCLDLTGLPQPIHHFKDK